MGGTTKIFAYSFWGVGQRKLSELAFNNGPGVGVKAWVRGRDKRFGFGFESLRPGALVGAGLIMHIVWVAELTLGMLEGQGRSKP